MMNINTKTFILSVALSISSISAQAANVNSQLLAEGNQTKSDVDVTIRQGGEAVNGGSITQGAGGIVGQQTNSAFSTMTIRNNTDNSTVRGLIENTGAARNGGSITQGLGGQVFQQN